MRVVKKNLEAVKDAHPNTAEVVREDRLPPRQGPSPEPAANSLQLSCKPRAELRVGIPRVLNLWSTHQFWVGFFDALGIEARRLEFSSDSSEDQARQFGKGRGTVDCCYPVKCISGHYGELLARDRHHKIDVLFSPMIYSLPSYLNGHVLASLACPRVMAAPENIKAGFLKEKDVFAEHGVRYVAPLVSLGDAPLVPKQLYAGLRDVLPGLTLEETRHAVQAGYRALETFGADLRARARAVLARCAAADKPCVLVLARPYHMDPGIGHEIEVDLQAYGYPVLWTQYLPTDADVLDWMFRPDIDAGHIKSPFDIADVWPSSYSANTNEILGPPSSPRACRGLPAWCGCRATSAAWINPPTRRCSRSSSARERSFSRSRTSTPPSLRAR